jgi:hypothetical protein
MNLHLKIAIIVEFYMFKMRLEGSTSRLNDIQLIEKISKIVARECCQIPKIILKQSFQNSKQVH